MHIDKETGEIADPMVPFWKTPYNHDRDAESARVGLLCKDPSLAQQNGKEEADINTIVDRFLKTGALPPVKTPPTYADFSEVFDFQSAMDTVVQAQNSFMALPANTRSRFNNDPAKFVAYVDHCLETGDLEPLREMKLAVPKQPDRPMEPPKGGEPPKPPEAPKEAST